MLKAIDPSEGELSAERQQQERNMPTNVYTESSVTVIEEDSGITQRKSEVRGSTLGLQQDSSAFLDFTDQMKPLSRSVM